MSETLKHEGIPKLTENFKYVNEVKVEIKELTLRFGFKLDPNGRPYLDEKAFNKNKLLALIYHTVRLEAEINALNKKIQELKNK